MCSLWQIFRHVACFSICLKKPRCGVPQNVRYPRRESNLRPGECQAGTKNRNMRWWALPFKGLNDLGMYVYICHARQVWIFCPVSALIESCLLEEHNKTGGASWLTRPSAFFVLCATTFILIDAANRESESCIQFMCRYNARYSLPHSKNMPQSIRTFSSFL